jgi:RNA polymerase sigma-70 factor, ECF subfamily
MELPELVERCRSGDAAAWEALVRRFQGRVYGVAYLYLGDREEARDLAQEVFVRIYRRLDTCTQVETFIPWMIQITRNAAIDRQRRMRARPRAVDAPVEEMTHLTSPAPSPAEEHQTSRRRDLVHRALQRLSGINREMILLKEIQGLSFETIAELLKAPIGTVKSRSNRARLEMAKVLAAMTKEEGSGPWANP